MSSHLSVRQLRFNDPGMASFPVARAPSAEKLRGGYYTPAPLAEFLAAWARVAGTRMLEPSCGDGAILRALAGSAATAVGIEFEATSTDTIHRVRMLNGIPPAKLAAASINTVTFAFSEVLGRSYGGGVLELEPREAEALPFPNPSGLTMGDAAKVDGLLRKGELLAALDHVDSKLLRHLDRDLLAHLRAVWERLRDRRLARGRKS